MKRLLGLVSCLVTMAAAPGVAFADDGEPTPLPSTPAPEARISETATTSIDAVHLRNGGLYRGRVTEIVPGSHVRVMLPTGETHKVPWADVERVIVASATIPPVGAPAAAPVEEKAPAPKVGPLARVHLKTSSTKAAYLYRRAAGTDAFVTACQAPCDELMPLGDTYRVGGGGMQSSKEFQLKGAEGDTINVEADGPSWLGIVGGSGLVLAGGVSAYVGTILALAGNSGCSGYTYETSYGYSSRSGCSDLRPAGFAALGIGAGAIALGLVILYPSMKTDIEQERATGPRDAFVRQPTWRTASAQESAAPGTAFPLVFGRSF
ncbi:MAG: uncharacterized protein JWP97_1469 [Labilithrix sp.]|nr:uncharacterized protein [Labilithrix sp.]